MFSTHLNPLQKTYTPIIKPLTPNPRTCFNTNFALTKLTHEEIKNPVTY